MMIHATGAKTKTKNNKVTLKRNMRRQLTRMLRKAEKKAKKLGADAQTPGNYEFIADDEHLTGYAGMFLIKDLANRLGVINMFREMVDIKKRSSTYSPELMSYLLVEQKIMGIASIEASEMLRTDGPYKALHGLRTYPCAQSFRNHLQRFTMANVKQLQELHAAILDLYATVIGPRLVNLLIDSKVITVYGEQDGAVAGYNPHKRGRKSYCLKLCTIESFGQPIVYLELCPGDEVSATAFEDFFNACERSLPDSWKIREVKLDSGYWSEEIIEMLERKKLLYTISAKKNGPIMAFAGGKLDRFLAGSHGPDVRIYERHFKPVKWKAARRYIVVKVYVGDTVVRGKNEQVLQRMLFEELKWRTQVLVTNRQGAAKECWYGYNKRALVENVLKELTYSYHAFRQPSTSAVANTANLVLGACAYTIMPAIKHMFFPKDHAHHTLAVVRRRLINVPARVTGNKRKTVHLPKHHRWIGVMRQIQEAILFNFVREAFP